MLDLTKPIEQLLNADPTPTHAMIIFAESLESANNLREDISDRFQSPVLMAAIDRLVEYSVSRGSAYATMEATGYTAGDALKLYIHEFGNPEND